MSSGKELDEDQLREMLGSRTKSLIERIDRNVRIGFVVLFIFIVLFLFDDFIISPLLLKNVGEVNIPDWLFFLSSFANLLIFFTFIYFAIQYYKVKKTCDVVCDLRKTLKKIIGTLTLYQRLFYLAIVMLLLAMGSAFATGFFDGFTAGVESQGKHLTDVNTGKLILVTILGITITSLFIGGVFLFLRWGFRRLYGNYILKLKTTLKELEELE